MRKFLSLALVLAMILTMGLAFTASAEETTQVGTPRNETLVMETQTPTDNPGQFNCYMSGHLLRYSRMPDFQGHSPPPDSDTTYSRTPAGVHALS